VKLNNHFIKKMSYFWWLDGGYRDEDIAQKYSQ